MRSKADIDEPAHNGCSRKGPDGVGKSGFLTARHKSRECRSPKWAIARAGGLVASRLLI
ncbi:MAG: hypothetical protein JWP25_5592 [Bradyrhizobium sp.]|nr:hypothetical protein [Bradyrhizobium sp.]